MFVNKKQSSLATNANNIRHLEPRGALCRELKFLEKIQPNVIILLNETLKLPKKNIILLNSNN
jgi:hypothetical protein